ncbi:gene transfer agent family protein [Sphingomonas sp. BN140010]|uniref:Gene transfer agent family protein n=1 Tax=Sphingomonas arvum TaxID=2992113 RepID=A0ABT3JHR2_9SPHN|nr:gene transfer agent family protein [Sphingomonas sp. BN140010]MCW3798623.1 gene transfer agent family protein [Sphingomonas sp. BN140010]
MRANPQRGEASLRVGGETILVRPTFAALVAAEEELGSLLGLIERASESKLKLVEMVALLDHLTTSRPSGITRERIGEAVTAAGLVNVTPILKVILAQILQGAAG